MRILLTVAVLAFCPTGVSAAIFSPVDAAGALSVAAYGFLAGLSRGEQDVPLAGFLGIMFVAWVLLGCACSTAKIPLGKIWFWAVALRAVGFLGAPVLEDDWYRYLWDGRVFMDTGNPYDKAPALFFADPQLPEHFQRILDGINHPDAPTIYGPVCQFAFLVSYLMAPGQLWPVKLLLITADLATLALLARMIDGRRLLLYAWCPLLIKEVAFTAHPETLGIAFMIAALVAFLGKYFRTTAICLALAMGTKIFAGLIGALLLLRMPPRHWLSFGGVLVGLYFPFWVQGSWADWQALKLFAGTWEFNSTLFGVISIWTGSNAARLLCAGMFFVFYAVYAWKWKGDVPRGDWIFGAFFLLGAVVNAWYLLWLLPFVALFPTAAGVAALVIVSLAYVHGLNLPESMLGPYDHPWWVRVVEVITVFVAGSLQFLVRGQTPRTRE